MKRDYIEIACAVFAAIAVGVHVTLCVIVFWQSIDLAIGGAR